MRRALLLALLLALPACRSGPLRPEDLELVSVAPAPAEKGAPEVFHLEVEVHAPGQGPLELQLPLPVSDAYQEVHTLMIQVGPDAHYAIEDHPQGGRVLKVTSDAPDPRLGWRGRIDREPGSPPALPPAVSAVPPQPDDLEAWARELQRAGVQARVVHGLQVREGAVEPCRWVEVEHAGDWFALDPDTRQAVLPSTRVRLGPTSLQATRGGKPVRVQARYRLTSEG